MLRKIKSRKIVILASSKVTFDGFFNTINDPALGLNAEVLLVPDSDRLTWCCRTRISFRLVGKKLFKPLIEELTLVDDLRVAFVIHQKRVLYPACALFSLISENEIAPWRNMRLYLQGEHSSPGEIQDSCRQHGIPLGIIVSSRHDQDDPYREIRRLFMQ